MTDRELIEAAAKASSFDITWIEVDEWFWVLTDDGDSHPWNPLTDDGDALRLAVKLGMSVCPGPDTVQVAKLNSRGWLVAAYERIDVPDPYAATRRAIVRAAAALGDEP